MTNPLVSGIDWSTRMNDYLGSLREALESEHELQDAPPLPYLTNQNQLPSEQRGEPHNRAEWEAHLAALDAEMAAYRATLPPLPDTSNLPIRQEADLYAKALYGGLPMDQVPQRVLDEWDRQYDDGEDL